MKWEGNRESDNVEDRRNDDGSGSGGGFSLGGGSLGVGTIAIALLASYFFGINPMTVLSLLTGGSPGAGQAAPSPSSTPPRAANGSNSNGNPAEDRMVHFVRTVLADTEDTWSALFSANNATYISPKLVLFTGSVPTACGSGLSASGPFYCPGDQKIYIDLSFYRLMQQRFNVSGNFAQAYVIAHEVGHHVQNLTGITAKVEAAQRHASQKQANALSVRVELQADCYAGVWAFHANQARSILEQGDVEGALKAAAAIGDDALQRQSQGQVVPDSFTHGTSAQRVEWFRRGIENGKVSACNTFKSL